MGKALGRVRCLLLVCGVIGAGFALPHAALAHRSGCHNLHTCPSDTASYICGDLGYPCDGSTSIENVPAAAINAPLLVESIFRETFAREITEGESSYWKKRFRAEKDSVFKLRRAMAWHIAHGSFGPRLSIRSVRASLISNINALFRAVYDGRNPTAPESQYWISRVTDKQTAATLQGAMVYHRQRKIQH